MRQEVLHEAERANLITEAGTFVIRCLKARGGKTKLLFDSDNGPFDVQIVPARPKRRAGDIRNVHRHVRRGRIQPEE